MREAASFSFYLRERQALGWRAFGSGLMDFCQRAIALTAGHTFMELERCAFIMPRISSASANSVSSTSFPGCHSRQENRATVWSDLNSCAWLNGISRELDVALLKLLRPARDVTEHAIDLFEPFQWERGDALGGADRSTPCRARTFELSATAT